MATDYVEDYEEVTGLTRGTEVQTKVVKAPKKAAPATSPTKVETA